MESDLGTSQQPVVLDIIGEPAPEGELPKGLYMVIPPEHAQPTDEDRVHQRSSIAAAKYLIYMNKDGGTYTPGFNNAMTNRSSVPTQTSTIPPWNVSDAAWQEIMSCVREQFAPFDVEITDVDPGNVPHFESVVAGRPQDVQLPSGVGGVSPFTSDCSVIDNSIVFTFAEVFGNNYRVICEVVAQEVAHSFGLDHEYECSDPMTYLTGCGNKSFQNKAVPCGEYEPRLCACGQQTQNSYQMLAERLGTADAIAPTVGITSPANGATVAPGFQVTVDAADDVAVSRVELYINGTLSQTSTQAPFTFQTDAGLGSGNYTIETRAYDSKNVASDSISVVVGGGGGNNNGGGANPDGQRPADLVGGCSAGGTGAGAGLMLLGLAALLVSRRRRI